MPGKPEDVVQRFLADNADTIAKIRQMRQEYAAFIGDVKPVKIDADISGALRGIAAVKSELAGLGDKEITVTVKYVTVGDKPGGPGGGILGGDHAAMIRELREISAQMDIATDSMGRMETHLGVISRSVQDSSASLDMQTQILRDNADAHNLVAAAAGRSAAATRDAAAVARDAASARYSNAMADYLAARTAAGVFGGGGRGGGGGGLGAAAAALGGGGGPDPGTAAAAFATTAGFVRRWYPAFHWAMMLSNELLATVGPAVVAGGAAAAVGYQGGQQVANRLQAIYSVAESLGPSLGITSGQFLGGGNALQQAQNIGGGGVYEILGAGVNIARTSASGAFAQLGLNTLAMVDRGVATMVQSFQSGMGNQIAGLTAGGTGYLQQFGDVAANIGRTFLNVAPNLPGVGGDLLSTLQGLTGGLRATTGWLGSALGPILSFEAGTRWGPTLVGGAGRLLATAGRPLITLGTSDALGMTAAGGLITDAGTGLARTGAALGALTAPQIGVIAAAAYTLGKGITYQTPFQQQAAGILSGVGQSGMVAGIPAILSGMRQLAGTPYTAPDTSEGGALRSIWGPFAHWGLSPGNDFHQLVKSIGAAWSEISTGTTGPANFQVAQQALQSLSDTMVNALGAGPQVQQVWQGVSHSAISMADAFNIATMAQLQLGSSFEKNGKLTAQAKTMIENLYAGYAPMAMNTGQFGAATGAVTAMQGLSKTQLSTVNSSLDQLVQIVSGGAAGTAAYAGLLQGLPAGTAQALTSFTAPASSTSPGSAAAWAAFASTTQPSVVSQLQQQTDWLRTAQTLGALKPGQSTGMAAYLLGQALPSARQSPAAMAMLSTIAQEYGGPAIRPGESAAAMFRSLNHWVKTFGDTGAQFNRAMTTGTEKLSSIPQDAQQFVQTVQGGIVGGMAQGIATYGAGLQTSFMQSVSSGKGLPASLGQYVQFLKRSGTPEQGALDMAQYAAQLAGASRSQQAQIALQVQRAFPVTIHLTPKVDPVHLPALPKPPPVDYTSRVHPPSLPPPPHGGTVNYPSHVQKPVAPPPPKGGTVVYSSVVASPGSLLNPGGGTTGMATVSGSAVRIFGQTGFKVPGYGGGDIWGPAMLEPGELVVPKDMVAAGQVDHLRGRIPGFAAGGMVQPYIQDLGGLELPFRVAMTSLAQELFTDMQQALASIHPSVTAVFGGGGGFRGGGTSPGKQVVLQHDGAVPVHVASVAPQVNPDGFLTGPAKPLPAAAQKVIDSFEKTFKGMGSPWGHFASEIMQGLLDEIRKPSRETAKMTQALVGKVAQEVQFGQQVAATAVSGLNLGGMQVATPAMTAGGKPYQYYIDQQSLAAGGGPLSVQQQMADYLQAEQSFSGDFGKLSRGHLNKGLMRQILAAGPIQGDALAQSILSGQGGIGAANKLWNQINAQANKLGIQGAEAVYGYGQAHGKNVKVGVHTDAAAAQAQINAIHGKTVTVNVNLNISTGGGGLSNADVGRVTKQVTQKVQAALLQQAKRNGKTGLQLQGYGS